MALIVGGRFRIDFEPRQLCQSAHNRASAKKRISMTNGRHPGSGWLIGLVSFAIVLVTGCPLPIYLPTSRESAPVVTFDATPDSIHVGQTVTLEWKADYSTHVDITSLGDVPASGSRTVSPSTDFTYVLTASGAGGTTEAKKTVTVTPVPPTPGTGR